MDEATLAQWIANGREIAAETEAVLGPWTTPGSMGRCRRRTMVPTSEDNRHSLISISLI